MCVYTHRDGAHRQRVTITFWLGKTLTNFSCAPNGIKTSSHGIHWILRLTLYQLSHHICLTSLSLPLLFAASCFGALVLVPVVVAPCLLSTRQDGGAQRCNVFILFYSFTMAMLEMMRECVCVCVCRKTSYAFASQRFIINLINFDLNQLFVFLLWMSCLSCQRK